MKFKSLLLINIIFSYSFHANAGCSAMGIQNGNVEILKCSYSDVKPIGAAMDVNINYSNEMRMGEQSAKDMKAKIFLYSEDKEVCKKYELNKKTYCMELQQWCIMTGDAPLGARFTVGNVRADKCPKKTQNPMNIPSL